MDYVSSVLISLLGSGLMAWHLAAWRRQRSQDLDARERNYRHRQFVRRMQTSAMLALLGVAILAGQLLTPWLQQQLVFVLFWGGVLVVVLWLVLLALADIVATQHHFSRLRTDNVVERAKLQAEARRLRAKANPGNGQPPKD
ncbi:MAG: hypothetical protein ABR915_18220 [Thermoguttaceae bacterium]|jgi:sterol desaturase/sphingolipid hydroxylase (fatty acid hydroxylase superfamily)